MAYAAVISLKQTLEGLLDSSRSRVQIPISDLKLFHDHLCYLKSFFDKVVSLQDSNRVEELENPVKVLLQTTQDLIESHVSDIFHAGSERSGEDSTISGFSRDLMKLREKLCSLIEMFKTMDLTEDQTPTGRFAADVDAFGRKIRKGELVDVDIKPRIDFGRNNTIVGLNDELLKLLGRLTEIFSCRSVISIVGMGGIGKTTLAREVFLNPLTIEHFDVRLFVEIGLEYDLEKLLRRVLDHVDPKVVKERTVDELGEYLSKYLYGKRYLIVLDDIWEIRVWFEVRNIFPSNSNGSAIILTTRMSNVAPWEGNILQKRFLDHDESWNLLHKMAFSDMECPSELIEIGRKIAASLGGLPLAIVMIGKLLSKSETSVETWRAVAEDIDSPIRESTIPNFLNLSYTQLPQHLKACFLYLGLFPPNDDIPAAQLIKLWVAEGFIEPVADKILEQKAQEYLNDLVSRSLVLIQERNPGGKIKTCRVHSMLQDLCVCEAREEKLFHILNKGSNSVPQVAKNHRRLGIHSDVVLDSKLMESVSAVRSLVLMCPQNHHRHELKVYPRFRWLRVLHAPSLSFRKFPDDVLKLVRLRYLAITYDGELPSSISVLWNLEVLIIHRSGSMNFTVSLPLEIWKLRKLRHLEYMGCYLPDPVTGDIICVMEKLLTLSGVCAASVTPGVVKCLPNLMKLGIWCGAACHTIGFSFSSVDYNNILSYLRHLESFKWAVMNHRPEAAASYLMDFPHGLRKISLSGCRLPWDHMGGRIGALPGLEILKLRRSAFSGPVWETCEGQFSSLKFLLLEDLDVKDFIVDSYNFPRLEHLFIRRCYELREIPAAIGEIPALQVIDVYDCRMSLAISARSILEEQQDFGNEDLQVRIYPDIDMDIDNL